MPAVQGWLAVRGTMYRWVCALMVVLASLGGTYGEQSRQAARVDIFADLSIDEMNQVTEFLGQQTSLNLVAYMNAKVTDSYIYLIDALRPNKAEALRHLDEDGPAPERVAKVIIFRGDLVIPVVQEYHVRPIPNPTSYELYKNPSWKDPIPFFSRPPFSMPEVALYEALMQREFAKIDSIVREATDGYSYSVNCRVKCLHWVPGMVGAVSNTSRQLSMYFVRSVEGRFLHPIGLQFVLFLEGVDETQWTIGNVWFQGQRFRNFAEMAEAKMAGTMRINVVPEPVDWNEKTLPSSLNFRGTPRPNAPKRGPVTSMPDGNRFEIYGRRISWLGWEFNYGMVSTTGLQLYDVRFLGDRIAYEIALQELSVFYSGGSPIPRHMTVYDSLAILGNSVSQLFRGIDCPEYAEFVDFTHHGGAPHVVKDGACVFEHDRGVPLRRHYKTDHMGGYSFAQGMRDVVLIFRQILCVGNYDYIVDMIFHQAGQIEVKISLTGYVLSTYYTGPEMNKYGRRLNYDNVIANIHHHLAHFKVDLDIRGTDNRFETLDIELEDIEDSWTPGTTLKNKYFVRNLKETEKNATYQYNFNTPKYLIVYNEKEKNKFGDHRGYRIVSEAMSKMLLPDDYRGLRSRSWTRYQMAVTRFKETERSSSSIYTTMAPIDPPMSFNDFLKDDENIVDKDLVLWVTVGTHHIPHTEDVPVVTTPGVQLSFFLLPYNYFDEDPSLASRDNIRVTQGPSGEDLYHYSGVPPPPRKRAVSTAAAAISLNLLLVLCVSAIVQHVF